MILFILLLINYYLLHNVSFVLKPLLCTSVQWSRTVLRCYCIFDILLIYNIINIMRSGGVIFVSMFQILLLDG
jgi:hypothetical protein